MTLANPTPDKRWKTNQLKPSGRGFLPSHPFTHGASHRSLGVWPPIKSLTLKGIHYLQAMFIQINDWNNLPNSGVPSEELAAPRAPLARCQPPGIFASKLTFPPLLSQPQAPKAAEPRPSPFLSLTLSQTFPLFFPDNIATHTPIPPLGQSLVPSLLGLTFPGQPRLLQDQSRMFPDFILDSYPKGPIHFRSGTTYWRLGCL